MKKPLHKKHPLATGILLLASLSGCSGMMESFNENMVNLTDQFFGSEDNSEPPYPLRPYVAQVTPKLLWRHKMPSEISSHGVALLPAFQSGKVLVANREGLVQALDSVSGEVLWESETGLPASGGPGANRDHVFIASTDADVMALNMEDGSIAWHTQVSSEVLAIPRVEQGIVVIRTIDGRITGLRESDGQEMWVYERDVPALSLRGTGSPVIHDDMVISGYGNGKMVALDLQTGQPRWETTVTIPSGRSELERLVDIDTDPLIVDSYIYVATYQNGISMLTQNTGDLLWAREELSTFQNLGSDWLYLYLTDENSDIWQVDQRNGGALWKQTVLHQRRLTAPVVFDDYVVIGDFEGFLHWLDRDDGRLIGRIRICEAPIEVAPVVAADVLYVYATDGTVASVMSE